MVAHLLYIQNFKEIAEGCLIWSWYLANDMQFFLITPWLVIFYKKLPKQCIVAIIAIIICSIGVQSYVVYHYDLSVSYFYKSKGEFFEDYYVKPYNRINAYLLGIIIAWMYFEWKDKKSQDSTINKLTRSWVDNVVLKWVLIFVGLAITFVCVALHYVFNHDWERIVTWHNVLYIIVSRPLFVIGLLLVIYPVMLGKEKNLFAILGAPFWNVLAKLTYGAYMFHCIILFAEKSMDYHSIHFTFMRTMFSSIHIWVLSYLLSLILTLFIELPLSQIERAYLFPKRREAVESLKENQDEEKALKTPEVEHTINK